MDWLWTVCVFLLFVNAFITWFALGKLEGMIHSVNRRLTYIEHPELLDMPTAPRTQGQEAFRGPGG